MDSYKGKGKKGVEEAAGGCEEQSFMTAVVFCGWIKVFKAILRAVVNYPDTGKNEYTVFSAPAETQCNGFSATQGVCRCT